MRWLGLALIGILVAAAVAFAASRLASQQIGLASEPVSAGDALAPAEAQERSTAGKAGRGKRGQAKPPSGSRTETAPPAEAIEPAPEYTEPAPTEPAPTPSGGGHSGSGHSGSEHGGSDHTGGESADD